MAKNVNPSSNALKLRYEEIVAEYMDLEFSRDNYDRYLEAIAVESTAAFSDTERLLKSIGRSRC